MHFLDSYPSVVCTGDGVADLIHSFEDSKPQSLRVLNHRVQHSEIQADGKVSGPPIQGRGGKGVVPCMMKVVVWS
jgi:hypothetical protein